jgi:hypothetical protein
VRATADPGSKRATVDLGDTLATVDQGDTLAAADPWGAHDGDVGAAAASDLEGTRRRPHEVVHDGDVAATAAADLVGLERDSVSLRCTRQWPLEVRTAVTWERLRRRDGESRGHVRNNDTPKACMTARWERLAQRISGFMRARVDP